MVDTSRDDINSGEIISEFRYDKAGRVIEEIPPH